MNILQSTLTAWLSSVLVGPRQGHITAMTMMDNLEVIGTSTEDLTIIWR